MALDSRQGVDNRYGSVVAIPKLSVPQSSHHCDVTKDITYLDDHHANGFYLTLLARQDHPCCQFNRSRALPEHLEMGVYIREDNAVFRRFRLYVKP